MKQHVLIKLQTMIDDDGEIEYNTIKQTGHLFKKGRLNVVKYAEEPETGQVIRNLISIQQDAVNIKRSGFITMNQRFQLKQKTESYYEHPHGRIHMETFTDGIVYEKDEYTGNHVLQIDYTVKLNGANKRKHALSLTMTKEDDE